MANNLKLTCQSVKVHENFNKGGDFYYQVCFIEDRDLNQQIILEKFIVLFSYEYIQHNLLKDFYKDSDEIFKKVKEVSQENFNKYLSGKGFSKIIVKNSDNNFQNDYYHPASRILENE